MSDRSLYEEEASRRRVTKEHATLESSIGPETSLLDNREEHYGSLKKDSAWKNDSDLDHDAEIEKLMLEGR
jgi:hypothetical protein